MKSSDESFDADSLLKDLVEIIDESPTASTTSTSASQLYLSWPTGNEVLGSSSADWPATRQQPEVGGGQVETEIATWSGTIGSDVTVALRDYTGGFSSAGVTNNPATWEAVFETEPAPSLTSVCLLPPELFDVNRLISIPSFIAPPSTDNHDDNVVMTTQGILLHNADPCDKLEDSLDVLDLDIDLDAGRPLDIRSKTPSTTILTLNPFGVWPIASAGPSHNVVTSNVIQLSSQALPLNVSQPLLRGTSEMEASLEDVGSGKSRLCSRCLSDSEVQLTGKDSPLLTRQGSKRQRKGTVTTRAPGVRGRSTSEAGPSRTTNTEDVRRSDVVKD